MKNLKNYDTNISIFTLHYDFYQYSFIIINSNLIVLIVFLLLFDDRNSV